MSGDTSIISAVTALAAVIVGPFVTWKVAKRQIDASNVSSKRQVWIDELRSDVAKALAQISRIQELKRPNPNLSREDAVKVFEEQAAAHLLAIELLMRIKLRLNPNEREHNDLVAAFQALSDASPDPNPGETIEDQKQIQKRFFAARDQVLVITQKILKNEWNRVRRGE